MSALRRFRRRRLGQALLVPLLFALVAAVGWAFVLPARPAARPQLAAEASRAQLSSWAAPRRAREASPQKRPPPPPPLPATLLPLLAGAPADAVGEDIAGSFVAYGHYLALVVATASLTVERLTIRPNMTEEEETRMQIADAIYGAAGLLSIVTGYLRATSYGKGWDFYQHEPIFWLKVTLISIAGASSFFVTVMIVKRAIAQRDAGDRQIAPVSEKLAKRMTSIINAELLAIGSIPLTATLMARGVGYAEWLPWQAGAAPAVLALGGLGFKYIKEAVDWNEDDEPKA